MKKTLLLTALAAISFSSQAELLKGDWLVEGDNRSLYDTETGLTWLSITETRGLSVSEMRDELANNEIYDGFRYATEDEVFALTIPHMNYNIAQDTGSSGLWTNIGNGATDWFRYMFDSRNKYLHALNYDYIMYAYFENDESDTYLSHLGVNCCEWARYVNTHTNLNDTVKDSTSGHFIVKSGAQGLFAAENPEYAASVPLAPTAAILGISLLGLSRRRKK